jgi:hypothetical protein
MLSKPVSSVVGTIYCACFCPLPPFYCPLWPVAYVCTPISLGFLSHADNHWPCVFNYMSHLISQSLHSFIQVVTESHVTSTRKVLLSCQLVWDFFIIPRRPRNVLPASDNKQWTAGDSGFPGLKTPGFHPGYYPDQLNPVSPVGLL